MVDKMQTFPACAGVFLGESNIVLSVWVFTQNDSSLKRDLIWRVQLGIKNTKRCFPSCLLCDEIYFNFEIGPKKDVYSEVISSSFGIFIL